MDWSDVGGLVKSIAGAAAPMLGTALGGPLGGAAGTILASLFGAENKPDAVARAIQADPEAALKLKQTESNNYLELQKAVLTAGTSEVAEQTKQLQSINQTMQIEAQSGHWPTWSWRPYWGFVSATAFLVVCIFVCCPFYKAIAANQPTAFSQIYLIIGAFTALFSIPGAILGIASWKRGSMQVEQAKNQAAPA
jgi:hypothetical protein